MSENKVPDLVGTPDPTVEVNKTDMRLYDADTLMDDAEKEKYRLLNVDAPERPSLTSYGTYKEGLFNEQYRNYIQDKIEKDNFNILVDTGDNDIYGRNLAELKSSTEADLAKTIAREGIVRAPRYNLDDPYMAEAVSAGHMSRLLGTRPDVPEWKQLEEMMYLNAEPNLGELTRSEEFLLPTAFQAVDPNKENEEAFMAQAGDALEMWYYQNIGAWNGLKAALGDDKALEGLDKLKEEMQEEISPYTILSLEQVQDVPDAFAFIQNMIITQGPDFAIMAGGPAAGAAIGTAIAGPVGTVAGALLGTTLSSGYIWLKSTGSVAQEDYYVNGDVDTAKAFGVGAAIMVIDRLGARGLIQPTDFLTTKGMAKVVTKYKGQQAAAGRVITTAEAKKEVTKTVRNTLKDLADDATINATHFLSKRQVALSTGKRLLQRGAIETGTEFTQELLQAGAVKGIPKNADEWEDLGWRLTDAAAAGGIVGITYNATGSLLDRNRIENYRDNVSYETDKEPWIRRAAFQSSQAANFNDLETAIEDYRGDTQGPSLDERADAGEKSGYGQRSIDKIGRGEYVPLLSAIKNTLKGLIYDENGNINLEAAILSSMEGAYNLLSGGNLFNKESSRLSFITQNNKWLNEVKNQYGFTDEEFSLLIDRYIESEGRLSTFKDPNEYKAMEQFHNSLYNISETISQYLNKAGLSERAKSVYDNPMLLLAPGLPDLVKISQNPEKFKDALANTIVEADGLGAKQGERLGEARANLLIDMITNGASWQAVQMMNRIGATKNIQDFYSTNTFERLKNQIVKETTYATRTQYRGINNSIVANLINKMVSNGQITEERANELAADLRMQINKHAHQFGKLHNQLFSDIQDISRTATSFGLMDMIIFAQFGEVLISFIGTNQNLALAVGQFAKNFALAFKNSIPIIKKKREKQILSGEKSPDAFQQLELSGYNSEELLAQQGADLNRDFLRKLQAKFYTLVGLEQTTNAVRVSRMIPAASVIHQMIESMLNVDLNNMTRGQLRTFERLTHYGINVRDAVKYYKQGLDLTKQDQLPDNEELQNWFFDTWENAIPKFVDEMSVRIKPGSRPTAFEDQRFGLPLFTQYLSFISHFHANILPRLYTVYLKDAAAPVAFHTFQMMVGTLVVAYVSQYLKDLLVRGELNPALEEHGGIQRAIQYSGLTGWGQDVYDNTMGNPYGFKSDGLFDYLLNSPTISHFSKVAKDISEGDIAEAGQRALPFGDFFREESAPSRAINFLIGE